jgi:hypothetical protein
VAPQQFTSEASQRIAEIARATGAERLDVMHLIKVAGIRPATDFRFENWSGISFAGLDLAGFDFTGANLLGCDFGRSRIAQARFDAAEIGYTQASTGGLRDIAGNGPHRVTNLREALDWDLFTKSWRAPRPLFSDDHLRVGAIFQDAPFAPELAIVPAPRESNVFPNEMESQLGLRPWMAVSRFAVTFDEWQVFAHETNATMPFDEGWGQHRFPVVNITWDDAQAYVAWLGRRTGRPYRLLTDAEWEYCCRASSHGQFNIGDAITQDDANFSPDARRRRTQTMRVGSFRPNSWGLFDMHGRGVTTKSPSLCHVLDGFA